MIVWLVGLSGAGKTTIGQALTRKWRTVDPATVLVDGDEIRELFRHNRSPDAYTVEGRRANAERIVGLCTWLDGQGINAVCSILCIFPEILAANRNRFSDYFEVFIDAPLDQLQARDGKGLYKSANAGPTRNVVGVDIPFPVPEAPDLRINNSGPSLDGEATAGEILLKMGV